MASVVGGTLLATCVAVAEGGSRSTAGRPRHFVVALVDDLGGYNVPWRNPEQKGPDLLELSLKEGMRLENFYTFKYCSPTRSSFLSARFPLHVNQLNGGTCDGGGIDLRMKLLPEKLRIAGYRSYMVGKGHIGSRSAANLPINRGFDHHLGFLGGGEDHWTQRVSAGVDLWNDDQPGWGLNGTYSCDLYSNRAVALIQDHAIRFPNAGMFMYLPFHDVHEPYQAESRFIDPSITDSGRQTMAAMVACVSEGTGNVSKALKAAGMWDTTLFVWSADNGGPQYWLGNNYPLRGGKGVDFEGGVATAAFVTGGALPSSLYGQASTSPIHVADLHFTICLLAGLDEDSCRDDHTPGVPPIDGVDMRAAFKYANITRPISRGVGSSAGTQEIVLSSNGGQMGDQALPHTGAYIDFNLSNGGPWKFVWNTSHVLKNDASPKGSGYWTGPVWPDPTGSQTKGTAPGFEPDPGCPVGGCLFNLRLDRTEHREFSMSHPDIRAAMAKRMIELFNTRFQTSVNYTGGYDNCRSIDKVVNENRGFLGPCCTKGQPTPAITTCLGNHTLERYSPPGYRGTWRCDSSGNVLTAFNDASNGGAAIGFARVRGVIQPPRGLKAMELKVELRLYDSDDSATCLYTTAGVIVGLNTENTAAANHYRDGFVGYSVAVTPPSCKGDNARLRAMYHSLKPGGTISQTIATVHLGSNISTAVWMLLSVAVNATHISARFGGAKLVAPLVQGSAFGCSAQQATAREPWEPYPRDSTDGCSVGVYQHRALASWRNLYSPTMIN